MYHKQKSVTMENTVNSPLRSSKMKMGPCEIDFKVMVYHPKKLCLRLLKFKLYLNLFAQIIVLYAFQLERMQLVLEHNSSSAGWDWCQGVNSGLALFLTKSKPGCCSSRLSPGKGEVLALGARSSRSVYSPPTKKALVWWGEHACLGFGCRAESPVW